jgi:hypothetical protein
MLGRNSQKPQKSYVAKFASLQQSYKFHGLNAPWNFKQNFIAAVAAQ